ncbi:ATP-dependent DNA helicase RecG [Rhodospirillum rubrum F11]|uniref:ATP-dependent DNA helicase RecG n=3 Tax=Rhodospirillum rubrum TaxID=1085 RepID=Q2RTL7_RHORT|nr:ATP-dependent DNA helicase RecG [Rhodospirillum rubrum]ABC22528.1 ATP-dependent DNA helicase RecG [Rhodospirillum rubrum ATCC 11170]AEO48246.1 ATP-dependent DNA helicase RecG [Rhodospirillum rubrum F11]MBK5954116.1 ATP-dependent DNA helicase RecG [Rhodospirillum rubrum]QXG82156.1 ATP-dependent DNA helicase RecG [Rhodospirillum rubrum]
MRPSLLDPLFRPLTSLKGAGKTMAPLIARLIGGDKVVDLLWHLPSGLVDRRFSPLIAEAPDGVVVTLTVVVEAHQEPPPRSPSPYRVVCRDASGFVTLVFFHGRARYLNDLLPVGETRVISGKVERFGGAPQIVHPTHVVPLAEAEAVCRVEPVYPLSGGVAGKVLARLIAQALDDIPDPAAWPDEWIDAPLKAREGWPGWIDALRAVHAPEEAEDLRPDHPARRRLAYDELLATQLALLLVRRAARTVRGRPIVGTGALRAKVLAALPFALTGAQSRSLAEIDGDMASPARMLRLLQGDVGSGKTVVALLTMLTAVEAGAQAALMAPTEILARQHIETLAPLCASAGVRLGLLTGRDKGRARAALLEALAAGEIDILVGTHALFQDDVVFAALAVVVVDEQHRFGVHQRLALSDKGRAVDVLVMTATPIPRTLTLTHYGDMDISRLDEKPPGRLPADTRVLPIDRLDDVIAAVARAIDGGAKVYWVCPLIEDSETGDMAAAVDRQALLADRLGPRLGPRVGLVHGRMKPGEKDAVMEAFSGNGLDLLVATTVIEVGVNVPSATVMVIEHAERFGLAQLHQLRGRIGRGGGRSTCLLLYAPPLGETARARLETMRRTDDGFEIAEEDLRLRGAGEVLGTRQSGLPVFRLIDPLLAEDLLAIARKQAEVIVETDPDLAGPHGAALRVLLYLFERDAAVRTLRSG